MNMVAAIMHPEVTINLAKFAKFLFKIVLSFPFCDNLELSFPKCELIPTAQTKAYPEPSIILEPDMMNGSSAELRSFYFPFLRVWLSPVI